MLLAAVAWGFPGPAAWAGCGKFVVNTTSTQIFIAPGTSLNYLFVQNTGETCNIYCSLCSSNAATYQGGTKLIPQAAWMPAAPVPNCDLACIGSNAGTPCSGVAYACEW